MNRIRTSLVSLAAGTLLVAPLVVATAGPANAAGEKERHFRVDGALVDFSVEKERRHFDVDVDLDGATPGTQWRVVLRHDGKVVSRTTRTADRDGDVDVDVRSNDTAGADTFKVTVKRVGGAKKSATVSFPR